MFLNLKHPHFYYAYKEKKFISFDLQIKSFEIDILVSHQNLEMKTHYIILKDANRTSMEQHPKFRTEIT